MKICIFGFWQDLGFGECFFSIQIQIKKRIEKLIFQLLARSWFWWMLFCIQILLTMTIENLLSFSFWQDLGFGECFFYSNSNWKKYWKLTFSAFGKILVLANAFSIQILIEKSIENWLFQLLARSWFWQMLFSIQIPMKNILKSWFFWAFGKILVLAIVFFLLKF